MDAGCEYCRYQMTDEFGDEVVESLKIYLVNHTEKGLEFSIQTELCRKTGF